MMIDNVVVVIENIFRNIEEGKGRHEAAKKGTSEVGMAITASTTTTIIVFLPMIFASGLAGILSRPMALTITMGLLSSLLVAFTLIPMISARLFNRQTAYGYRKSAGKRGKGYLENFKKWYAKKLELALCNRKKVLAGAGAAFVLSIVLVSFLGFEFMPTSDSPITLMKISLPVGTPLEETNRITGKIERMFLNLEEKKIVAAVVGSSQDGGGGGMGISDVNEAMIIAQLVNKEKRKRSSGEITDEIRSKIPKLKSSKIEFIDMSGSSMGGGMGEGGSFPVNIKVFGDDLEVLKGLSAKIIKKIEGVEGLRDINSTYNEGKPEIRFVPNKEKASLFGLTTAQVGMAVSAAQSGKVATRYREHGKTTDVRVRFMKKDRNDLHDLENILIATPFNTQVPLKQLVNIKYSEGPIKIAREDKKRLVCVTANIKDRSISAIVDDIRKKLKDMTFPQGYFIEFGGSYEQTTDTLITLLQAFIAAVLLIYMVLAILYESLAQPFIILFTVPLSIIGVIVGLFFFGMTVSTPSFMGIIILAGVVVNNGIVMIDYVNRLRRQGMEKHKALIQGALTRVRPIFITSFTTIMGVLPMAFSRSQGSEMRAPIGVSLGSGLFFGMFLTLFIIPVIYSVVDHISFNVKNKSKKMFHGG